MIHKLSVVIPAYNEAENIADCIKSVGDLADELVVLDSFSTDRTVEIARSLHAEVHQRKFDNYSANKNYALGLLHCDWVFILDADERLTPALREEIRQLLRQGPVQDGYEVRRETYFCGKRVRCWSNGRVLRLFRRNKGRYREEKLVHEELILDGTTGRLRQPLEHYTFRSFEQYMPKMQSFAFLGAEQAFQKGERTSWIRLFFYPPLRFAKAYFLRGGILDGLPGLLIAWLSAYSTYLRHARLWELQNDNSDAAR